MSTLITKVLDTSYFSIDPGRAGSLERGKALGLLVCRVTRLALEAFERRDYTQFDPLAGCGMCHVRAILFIRQMHNREVLNSREVKTAIEGFERAIIAMQPPERKISLAKHLQAVVPMFNTFADYLILSQLLHLCQRVNTSIEGTIEHIKALDTTEVLDDATLEQVMHQSSLECSRVTLRLFREMVAESPPLLRKLCSASQEAKHRSFGIPSLPCYATVLGMVEEMRRCQPLVVLRFGDEAIYFRDFRECPRPDNVHEGPLMVFLGKLKEGASVADVVHGRTFDDILYTHGAGCLQFKVTFDKDEVPLFAHREFVPFLEGREEAPPKAAARICKGAEPEEVRACFREYYDRKQRFPEEAFTILHTFSE